MIRPLNSQPQQPGLLADLVTLSKPRILMAVMLTGFTGYFYASQPILFWRPLVAFLGGVALTAAAAGALNQYLEKESDGRMARTAQRPLPSGRRTPLVALILAAVTAPTGLALLWYGTNHLTALMGLITLVLYLYLYTPLKPKTPLNTFVGAIPGALPPMAGYVAVHGGLDKDAWIIFGLYFCWQVPHFYALAWLHREDYRAGLLKMLPVVDRTGFKSAMLAFFFALGTGIFAAWLGLSYRVGWVYQLLSSSLSLFFLYQSAKFWQRRTTAHAARLFGTSLIYLPIYLSCILLDRFLNL